MTPQLQQAIRLLQYSSAELTAYVESELERNPLLEKDGDEAGKDAPAAAESPPAAEPPQWEGEDAADASPGTMPSTAASALDAPDEDVWPEGGSLNGAGMQAAGMQAGGMQGASGRGAGQGESWPDYEQTLRSEPSLRDHLMGQVNIDLASPAERRIGRALIEHLNDAGYFVGEIGAVAAALGCPDGDVEAVLGRMQGFDPPGIFARDLKECLAIQLADRDRFDPAMQTLLAHLDLVARRDWPALMRLCGVDGEDIAGMLSEIRALDPKPAQAFDAATAPPVTPDVIMRARPGGGWLIELNDEALPRVLVNARYYTEVSGKVRTRNDRAFVAEHYQSATWLVKALHQRATTILRVASEIVRRQDAFFAGGVHKLKPLILRDIAEELELHESTVSRVTANKFLGTPRGVFELKYFFSNAIAHAGGGEGHAAESVRARIKELIEAERRSAVLSDEHIVKILRAEGVVIARRTVAKYRDTLHIPSSARRRRERASAELLCAQGASPA